METVIDPDTLEAWLLFLKAHSLLVAQLERELDTEQHLPLTWYDVLVQLSMAPEERLRLQDLVRSLVLTTSGLSRRIDRMVAAGLVVRKDCPEDRRGVLAALTPKGKETLQSAAPIHFGGIQEHFAQYLSPEETAVLRFAFQKMLEALEQRQPGRPPCDRAEAETCAE